MELSKLGFRRSKDLFICESNQKKIEIAYAISIIRMLNRNLELEYAAQLLCRKMDESNHYHFSGMQNQLVFNDFSKVL